MDGGNLLNLGLACALWGFYVFLFAGYREQKMKVPWFVWAGLACLFAATVITYIEIA